MSSDWIRPIGLRVSALALCVTTTMFAASVDIARGTSSRPLILRSELGLTRDEARAVRSVLEPAGSVRGAGVAEATMGLSSRQFSADDTSVTIDPTAEAPGFTSGSMTWLKGVKEVTLTDRCKRTRFELGTPSGSITIDWDGGAQAVAAPSAGKYVTEVRR